MAWEEPYVSESKQEVLHLENNDTGQSCLAGKLLWDKGSGQHGSSQAAEQDNQRGCLVSVLQCTDGYFQDPTG